MYQIGRIFHGGAKREQQLRVRGMLRLMAGMPQGAASAIISLPLLWKGAYSEIRMGKALGRRAYFQPAIPAGGRRSAWLVRQISISRE